MRSLLNEFVLFIFKKCSIYIDKHIYKGKHENIDYDFWDESDLL